MQKKIYGAALLALTLGITSCNEDNPWMTDMGGEGAIQLTLHSDGTVKHSIPETRAQSLFRVPEAGEFSIHLEKTDGSFSKVYELLEHFKEEKSFPTGSYTLRAFYGKLEDEGFDKPYLEGTVDLNVLENRTTTVSVNAKVANSLVTVNYTDNFKNYLSDYKTTLHSVGHSFVEVPAESQEPVFLAPGEVELTVTFSNPQGQSVTLQPASFVAVAGHHYNLTYDVNGSSNDLQLEIQFDDTLEEENIYIDLTEELFTAKPPVINPVGFENNGTLEFLAHATNTEKYRFNVISHGGLNKVTMTIATDKNLPFGKEIELIGADSQLQNQLADYGFNIKGIYKNPEQMAFVDFTNVLEHLDPGTYTVSLQSKDYMMRASEPVQVTLTSVEPTIEVEPLSALYGVNKASMNIRYTGSHPNQDLKFQAMNQHGVYVDAPIASVSDVTRTRSIETNSYNITINLPDMERDMIPVIVYLYGQETKRVEIPVEMPQFEVENDAFANKVLIKVNATEEQKGIITSSLKIFDGNSQIAESRIKRDELTSIITVSGLNPGQTYNFKASLRRADSSDAKAVSFTTEQELAVPNGNFTETHNTIDIKNINNGGEYKAGVHSRCFNTTDIVVDEPTGWASINELTCYQGSQNRNTWFMVPSTYMENGAVKVRSVAYSHNGEGPEYRNYGTLGYVWYSQNAPASIDSRASGELFLGEYSFTGIPARTDGIEFASRPSSVTFEYEYNPINDSEVGEVYVALLDKNSNVISTVSADITSTSKTTKTLTLPAYAFGNKAASLRILFKSTKGNSIETPIKSGTDLNDTEFEDNSLLGLGATPPANSGFHMKANQYYAKATGSELTVYNVKLNY